MQRTAVSWVVYSMTHSTFMLGLAIFAGQFPSFILSVWGGVVSDRYDRYKVLLATQIASMIQAMILAVLVLLNVATVWEIIGLGTILGVINAFDLPARQSLVYAMVDSEDDLPNAIALNSSMVNMARLVGPAISGFVLEKLGDGFCFALNAASFVAVIGSLLLMRLEHSAMPARKKDMLGEFREGMSYLKHTPSIALVILMLALMSLLVTPFNTLLPVYAKVIFKGNATTFGYLNSAIGLGALFGAIFLASLKNRSNLRKILFINTLIFGVGLILFSHASILPVALVFAMAAGFGMMSQTTISNTIIQTTVHPSMRGRVISYYAMAFMGMMPIGGLLVGAVSQYVGAPDTILVEGILALIIAMVFSHSLLQKKTKKKIVVQKPHITNF